LPSCTLKDDSNNEYANKCWGWNQMLTIEIYKSDYGERQYYEI